MKKEEIIKYVEQLKNEGKSKFKSGQYQKLKYFIEPIDKIKEAISCWIWENNTTIEDVLHVSISDKDDVTVVFMYQIIHVESNEIDYEAMLQMSQND